MLNIRMGHDTAAAYNSTSICLPLAAGETLYSGSAMLNVQVSVTGRRGIILFVTAFTYALKPFHHSTQ
jgi:hypothetical protein